MKILITGAGGFLGNKLAIAACEQGVANVRLQVRQRSGHKKIAELSKAYPATTLETVSANLLSHAELEAAVAGCDIVIHAAAGTKGTAADMYANSVIGTRNLVAACKNQGVRRIVLISSFSVFETGLLPTNSTIDESTPIEKLGVEKGVYAYTKVQQERVFRTLHESSSFEFVVLRPGVIYGPDSAGISTRVGISAFGMFASLGSSNLIPLTYVDNCADAIVLAALKAPPNTTYNIVDDGLITCNQFLKQYQKQAKKLNSFPMPYFVLNAAVRWLNYYSRKSHGQLPAILTPYIVKSMYRPFRYTNAALKALGWRQRVSTDDGLKATFAAVASSSNT